MKRFPLLLAVSILLCGCAALLPPAEKEKRKPVDTVYFFPSEDGMHEGTWLNWPHEYTYGLAYRQELEPIWTEMVCALHSGEQVHIIIYSRTEQEPPLC